MYDYMKAITDDVMDYIREHEDELEGLSRDELQEKLQDDLWIEDSVTGNGSGSYTFSTAKSRENVLGDNKAEDYIRELISEYGLDAETIAKHLFDWEYWDVSIRCYLLGQAIWAALSNMGIE